LKLIDQFFCGQSERQRKLHNSTIQLLVVVIFFWKLRQNRKSDDDDAIQKSCSQSHKLQTVKL